MQDSHPAVVAPVQPFRTKERVTSQQGLFPCSNSSMFGFELGPKQVLKGDREDLSRQFGPNAADWPERLCKIVIAPAARSGGEDVDFRI
jgi:hypothetical protein